MSAVVYALGYCGRPAYVGRSINLDARIQYHIYAGKRFDSVWHEVVDRDSACAREMQIIRAAEPHYNILGTRRATVQVRGHLDNDLFVAFKSIAVKRHLEIGDCVRHAVREWVEKNVR